MKKALLVAAVSVCVAAPAGAALNAKWRVIGKASAKGTFPIATAHGEVKTPRALRVRALGSGPVSLNIIYSCSRDVKLSPGRAVPLRIRGSDSCDVVAGGSGDAGRIEVRIEALR